MRKLLILSTTLALAILLWVAFDQITTDTILSESDIESRVATLYDGTVTNSVKQGERYFVTFEKAGATYEVTVNEIDGGFSSIELIAEAPVEEKPPAEPEPPSETEQTPAKPEPPVTEQQPVEKPPSQVTLTEQQVSSIALAQIAGEVDDIDFISTADGGYYLVEVDAEEDVIIQVHAITGKVLSVTFDD